MKSKSIPLFNPADLGRHHFETWDEWQFTALNDVFHINRLETHLEHIPFPLAPHRKTVHDFIFLTQGRTRRSKGLNEYDLGKNTFFFLPATQITTHEFMSPDSTGFFCHFDLDLLTKSFVQPEVIAEIPFLRFTGNPLVHVPEAVMPRVLHLMQQMEEELNAGRPDVLDLARVYLLTLFFELKRYADPSEKTGPNAAARITQQYKNALMQHIYEKHNVSTYAELLAVSPNHLNKCVKATTGRSAQDTLDDMVLLEAKALLKQSELSISEIAFKLGKEDHSNFSRFFKAKTQTTPKEYKLSK
ncbi:helix-turn-helix domain-containing protein [Hymenobacter sp. BT491]|uniref:helix-turn-helix domain-containing protein n=1 Tax=Hymenobacter sp. BT491 TaxID=2766779 RepID=UPI001653BF36|nr:AraC family transcriptional regulator [Hymenobacter sp. BT491]MBC6991994.1 AraC family transcriptional regulator [Hymenobacter sp. BT491]